MKRIINKLIPALSLLFLASCQSNTEKVDVKSLESSSQIDPAYTLRTDEELGKVKKNMEGEYSKRTVIVNLSGELSDSDVEKLAGDYDLDIVYIYKNFNSCALSAKRDLTEEEMASLIEKLTNDSRVLSVSRDAIMHLL